MNNQKEKRVLTRKLSRSSNVFDFNNETDKSEFFLTKEQQKKLPHSQKNDEHTKKETLYCHIWNNNAPIWKSSDNVQWQLQKIRRCGSYTSWGCVGISHRAALKKEIYRYIKLSNKERTQWLDDLMFARRSDGTLYKVLEGQWEVVARQEIKKWSLIGHYAGVVHDKKSYADLSQKEDLVDLNLYAVDLASNQTLSGFRESNICSLINAHYDYKQENKGKVKANVQYTYHRDKQGRQYVIMITTKKVRKGEILWADYGKGYWNN